jgi:hypothetical protein
VENFESAFSEYLQAQDEARRRRVGRILEAMTKRERQLIKEIAVMAWVRGGRASGYGHAAIPLDSEILKEVILACLSMEDLYPTVARLERVARQRERRARNASS